MNNNDDYYTVTELANAIGYSRQRIYQLIDSGRIIANKTKLGCFITRQEYIRVITLKQLSIKESKRKRK